MSNIVLELKNVRKTFDGVNGEELHILKGVNLSVNEGEKVAIIGQSGSGKSTLMHIAGLLDTATEGEVVLNNKNATKLADRHRSNLRNNNLGFVYQYHHLLPDFTALENVLMPVRINNKINDEVIDGANEILNNLNMEHRSKHLPGELSGGEQQRVAIARALIHKPQILLADEPTGNLDPETAEEVYKAFNTAIDNENMALLMVTHNEDLAMRCDKVYRMDKGHLEQVK